MTAEGTPVPAAFGGVELDEVHAGAPSRPRVGSSAEGSWPSSRPWPPGPFPFPLDRKACERRNVIQHMWRRLKN